MTGESVTSMTESQVRAALLFWQDTLGLSHWTIKFDPDATCDDDCNAKTWRSNDYDKAAIWLSEDWRQQEPHVVEQLLVHELLHIQHRDVENSIEAIDGQLHRDADSVFRDQFSHAVEGFVDRLSVRLVELRHGELFDWTSTVTATP